MYKIECNIDQKIYAGITNNVKRRWKEHRSELRSNRHHNFHLQYAWNKYSEKAFNFVLVNEFNSLDAMNKAEVDYIEKFDLLNSNNGYNLAPKEIVEYKCTYDVRQDGFNITNVYGCCTKPELRKTHKGFVWSFNKEKLEERRLATYKHGAEKNIYKFTINGEFIGKLNREGLSRIKLNGISSVCTSIKETYKGFKYSYEKILINTKYTKNSFDKYDKKGILMKTYLNMSELLLDNPDITNTSNIYRCCKKERNTAYGFKWSYGGGLSL